MININHPVVSAEATYFGMVEMVSPRYHNESVQMSQYVLFLIKTNLSEVSLEFAKAVRDKTEYRVIPGKRLCLHCQIFLKDLIATVDSDEENYENIPE